MELVRSAPHRRVGFLEALGLLGGVIFAAARWLPVERLPFWSCAFRDFTGWPCLGCGLTRAAQLFVRGEPLAALAHNPLGTVLYAALAVTLVAAVLHLALGWAPPRLRVGAGGARNLRLLLAIAVISNYGYVAWCERGVLG